MPIKNPYNDPTLFFTWHNRFRFIRTDYSTVTVVFISCYAYYQALILYFFFQYKYMHYTNCDINNLINFIKSTEITSTKYEHTYIKR